MKRHYFPDKVSHPFRHNRHSLSHGAILPVLAGHRVLSFSAVSLVGVFMPIFWYELFGTSITFVLLFYFINSINSLSELDKLMQRYDKAPPKGKSKLAIRIQEALNTLDPNVQDDISSIASRLDKPVVGGVSFRGADDDKLKDISVTHECIGSGGIAFQKIVLIHQ